LGSLYGLGPIIPTIPHQISKYHLELIAPTAILYTSISMETVKLNFHLEQ
jgi:hypothetical protein